MDAAPELLRSSETFGPEATSPGQKNGAAKAEARRPKDHLMQTNTITTNIPRSIASTVTVFDAKEVARREKEAARTQGWLEECLARGRNEVFSEAVTITPVLADLLLRKNIDNRKIRANRLIEIRNDLEKGQWSFNGEAIVISREGMVNDGQHRLMACRDSGVPMRAILVFGVQRSTRLTVDQGTVRTVADYLDMDGERFDPTSVAAVARMVFQYDRSGTIETRAIKHKYRPTKIDISVTASQEKDRIRRSLEMVGSGSKALGPRSLLAFAHCILSRKDADAADFFIRRLIDGTDLKATNPIHILRGRLIGAPDMPPHERLEVIIRAWNAVRTKAVVQQLKVMGRGLPKVEG